MPPAITIARRALRVGIVGGGLCGFGAALLLQRAGVRNVTVFERDLSPYWAMPFMYENSRWLHFLTNWYF